MQDYIQFAQKNRVQLIDSGPCQFCGAKTKRGIHECLEIFNLGFQEIDYSLIENHIYRFLIVDAHTLQHPEIHGRWNNHFHLSRLHLILAHNVTWTYDLSSRFSDYLKSYKVGKEHEYLTPPPVLERGHLTTTDILANSHNQDACKAIIRLWARDVYQAWGNSHPIVDSLSKDFLDKW